MKKISMTMIVRDEVRTLSAAIASVRPYVDQIVVVDTGSTDGTVELMTDGALKTEIDVVELFTKCNHGSQGEGPIEDFAMARNFALALAEHDVHFWMDADDVLLGGDKLRAAAEHVSRAKTVMLLPYTYAPSVHQRRERLHHPRTAFAWEYAVHESLESRQKDKEPTFVVSDTPHVVHMPHPEKMKQKERGRNLRILQRQLERTNYLRPREMFYMIQELRNDGRLPEAAKWAEILLALPRGPSEDERAIAWMWLSDIRAWQINHEGALIAALRAHAVHEDWPWPVLKVGEIHYYRAFRGEEFGWNMRRAIHFLERGLSMPDADTSHFVDPRARLHAKRCLNVALGQVGRHGDALRVCEEGLEEVPSDGEFLRNRATHLEALGRRSEAAVAYERAADALPEKDPTRAALEAKVNACLDTPVASGEDEG